MGSLPFDLPNLDTDSSRIRALGVKNSGVSEFTFDRVFPVTRMASSDRSMSGGRLAEFRMRSDSSRWINWRETKLQCMYEVAMTTSGTQDAGDPVTGVDLMGFPMSTRMIACPNHAVFDAGMSYTLNSTTVENNTHPHQSAMIALQTRTDMFDVATTGSGSLMSLQKDSGTYGETIQDPEALTGDYYVSQSSALTNPKIAVLQNFYDVATKKATFDVAEPLIALSSLQHGYFAPPGDHRLEFTVANNFANQLATDFTVETDGTAMQISSEPIPTSAAELNANPGKLYINISNIELSVCYVSPSGPSYIPRSVALKFSPYMITTKAITGRSILESIVCPPATRAVYLWVRQTGLVGLGMDNEELGLATMGINVRDRANTADTTKIATLETLEVQLGSSVAGRYTGMDPFKGKMQRPWNDYLSTIGKPTAMRGGQMTYGQYCGVVNEFRTANAPSGFVAANRANVGRTCGGFYMRILNPSGNLSNVMRISGELNATPGGAAGLELVVCCVSDRLLQCEYVEGQEIPTATRVTDIL